MPRYILIYKESKFRVGQLLKNEQESGTLNCTIRTDQFIWGLRTIIWRYDSSLTRYLLNYKYAYLTHSYYIGAWEK